MQANQSKESLTQENKTPETRVIFVRHGETQWNTQARMMGQLNSPLTPKGEQQVLALGERLKPYPISALYSSDLGRAMQTAQAIADASGLEITQDKGLREIHMGDFQGYTYAEIAEKFPDEWQGYQGEGQYTYQTPNGESHAQKSIRAVETLNRLTDQHVGETIVMVSHAGILRAVFEYVLQLPPNHQHRFQRNNATFNLFSKIGDHWSLAVWGDETHLSEALRG
jgi:probable phosphoglycerate mutase